MFKTYSKYIKELFSLAFPMIVGNLGIVLIGAGDVFVAARHSTDTLAAISIGNSIIGCVFLFGMGLLASISPLLSNFRGEKSNIKKYFLPTIYYSIFWGALSCLSVLIFIPLIDNLGFEGHLIPDIKEYMFISSFSIFGAYLQMALKEFLQAFEIVIFPNLINIFGVFLNLFLCFVLVFGLLGFPQLGVVGLAFATLISRTVLGLIMLGYCLTLTKIKVYHDRQYFVNLVKIGFPIAMAILIEVFAFNVITIFVGRISGVFAAAQNILLTVTTATFMIPMAISNALAVKIGFANGAGNFMDLKRYAYSGLAVSIGFMAFCALCFLIFPSFFIHIFTKDAALLKICVPALVLAGVFQIFDGMQVSLGGIFKGLKKTKIIMLGDFLAYIMLGLPLGIVLAFKFKMELFGFWVGLTIAIFALAIIFLLLLRREFKKSCYRSNSKTLL